MSVHHPRAAMWAHFAAASLSRPYFSVEDAVERADRMLAEFDKRFEWYEGGYGAFWQERTEFWKKERTQKKA